MLRQVGYFKLVTVGPLRERVLVLGGPGHAHFHRTPRWRRDAFEGSELERFHEDLLAFGLGHSRSLHICMRMSTKLVLTPNGVPNYRCS
jgi:hypothetical protein